MPENILQNEIQLRGDAEFGIVYVDTFEEVGALLIQHPSICKISFRADDIDYRLVHKENDSTKWVFQPGITIDNGEQLELPIQHQIKELLIRNGIMV